MDHFTDWGLLCGNHGSYSDGWLTIDKTFHGFISLFHCL